MRRPPAESCRAVLVVALVVLAGCTGFLGGGSGENEATDSGPVTPAPVPDTPNGTSAPGADVSPPPGIDGNRITNESALIGAHQSILANETFRLRVTATDETVGSPSQYIVHGANGSRLLVTTVDGEELIYRAERADFRRDFNFTSNDPELRSERVVMRSAPASNVLVSGVRRLREGAASVTRVQRDGATFYRVHRTEPPGSTDDISNFSLTAYVRADGFVKTIDLSYDQAGVGRPQHVDRRWTYSLDAGPLEEPDWVTRTRNGNLSAFATGEYPPGINGSGLADLDELWAAHRTHLGVQSFTLNRTGDLNRTGNRILSRLPPRATVAVENRSRYHVRRANESDTYVAGGDKYNENGIYLTQQAGRFGGTVEYWVKRGSNHGRAWLQGDNTSVERVEQNGTTRFRLTVSEPLNRFAMAIRNVTTTALIGPAGLIRTIEVELAVADDEGENWTDTEYRYSYDRIGNTTVTEPAWVTRMQQNRTATPVATTARSSA